MSLGGKEMPRVEGYVWLSQSAGVGSRGSIRVVPVKDADDRGKGLLVAIQVTHCRKG